MNVNVTIGVTPELAKLLGGLTQLGKVVAAEAQIATEEVKVPPAQQQAPMQQAQQQAPVQQQQAPVPSAQQQAPTLTAVPTATTSYTMEQLAVAATQLVDAGKRNELLELLNSFGVQALTALPKEQYGTFATQLRDKGAKI